MRTKANQTEKSSSEYVTPSDIRELLVNLKKSLTENGKATVSEYLRLVDLLRELEPRSVTEVKVGWHDSLNDE